MREAWMKDILESIEEAENNTFDYDFDSYDDDDEAIDW